MNKIATVCHICNEEFESELALEAHFKSKEHKDISNGSDVDAIRIWWVEISQRYALAFPHKEIEDGIAPIAELKFKVDTAQKAVVLGNVWIAGKKIIDAFVSTVWCDNPYRLDFTEVDFAEWSKKS